jgi:hypothetical protein
LRRAVLERLEKKKKKKKGKKKNCAMRCDASVQYGERKGRRTKFFSCVLIEEEKEKRKNVGLEKEGVGDEKEKKKRRQDACTNHVLERLACALSMPL